MNFPIKREIITITTICVLFLIFYIILSIVPHYNFATNAWDLGIFNQTLWQYSHFEIGTNTIRRVPNLFADHLEFIMFLFAPFYYLFGSYTLLIFQIIAIIFGGIGTFLLAKDHTKDSILSIGALLIFFLFFGTIGAICYDYHNNVVGAMFIPWIFWFLRKNKFLLFYLCFFLLLFSKENMALLGVFIGFSILFFETKNKKIHGLVISAISVTYFLLALYVIIPAISPVGYDHWLYTELGKNATGAIISIITNPIHAISLLFDNELKIRAWKYLAISGGLAAIFYPRYSILFIPLLAQKFFASVSIIWLISGHYNIEFAPIIAVGCVCALSLLKIKKWIIYSILCIFIIGCIYTIPHIPITDKETPMRIFNNNYYYKSYIDNINECLKLIPKNAPVSAQNTIVPHIAGRAKIYLFPDISDSDFIILNFNDEYLWPVINTSELEQDMKRIQNNHCYDPIYNNNGVMLFKKRMCRE